MSDKYAAIAAHGDRYPVRLMCEALDMSVSGVYDAAARQQAPPSAHAVADERLRVHVRAIHAKSRRRYCAPRVHRELRAQGIPGAKNRVARLMREDRLVARRRRRFVHTTDSAHTEPIAPNLLDRSFALAAHPAPDRAWVGDMTYVPTGRGGCISPCCSTWRRGASSAGPRARRSRPRCRSRPCSTRFGRGVRLRG